MASNSDDSNRVIHCCKQNVTSEVRDVLADRHDVRERLCLQRCGECYDTGFFVVDGVKVEYERSDPAGSLPSSLTEASEDR